MKVKSRFLSVFVLTLIFFFSSQTIKAQFNVCIDSSLLNAHIYCTDTTWNPECGCNTKTYRNDCARQQAGVAQYTDRTCEEITIVYYYPNPVTDFLNFRLYLKNYGNPYVYVFDVYGHLYYQKVYLNVNDVSLSSDLSNLPNGFYILMAVANGQFSAKKFMKMSF